MSLSHLLDTYTRVTTYTQEEDRWSEEDHLSTELQLTMEQSRVDIAQVHLDWALATVNGTANKEALAITLEAVGDYTQENILTRAWDAVKAFMIEMYNKFIKYLEIAKEFIKSLRQRTKSMRKQLDSYKPKLKKYNRASAPLQLSPLHASRIQIAGLNPKFPSGLITGYETFYTETRRILTSFSSGLASYHGRVGKIVDDINSGRHYNMVASMAEVERQMGNEIIVVSRSTVTTLPMPYVKSIGYTGSREKFANGNTSRIALQIDPIKITYSEASEPPTQTISSFTRAELRLLVDVTNNTLDMIDEYSAMNDEFSKKQASLNLSLKTLALEPDAAGMDTTAISKYAHAVRSVNNLDKSISEILRMAWQQVYTMLYLIDKSIETGDYNNP